MIQAIDLSARALEAAPMWMCWSERFNAFNILST
jgi:hypothetical protein